MFNKNKFCGRVVTLGVTLNTVAYWLGISYSTLYRKINGESDFTRNEVAILISKLHLTNDETIDIFFDEKLA